MRILNNPWEVHNLFGEKFGDEHYSIDICVRISRYRIYIVLTMLRTRGGGGGVRTYIEAIAMCCQRIPKSLINVLFRSVF